MLGSALNTIIASNRGLNRDNPCPYREIYRSTSYHVLMNLSNVSACNGMCQTINTYRDDCIRMYLFLADRPAISKQIWLSIMALSYQIRTNRINMYEVTSSGKLLEKFHNSI